MGGAVDQVPIEATAYPARKAEWVVNLGGRWEDPSQDEEVISWTRQAYADMKGYGDGTAYSNFCQGDTPSTSQEAFGFNLERLVKVKEKYNPSNFCSVNVNMKPPHQPAESQ
jgi:hypothetical protein